MAEHTPGPWAPYHLSDGSWAVARRDDVLPPLAWTVNEADARLIAAAPDLLAALEEIVNLEGFPDQFAYRAEAIALAAIAKAKGKTDG